MTFIPGNRARWCESCQGYFEGAVCPMCGSGEHWCPAEREPQGKLMMEVAKGKIEVWRKDGEETR